MALKDSFVREVLPYLMASWCVLTVLLNIIFGVLTIHLINKQLSFTPVAQSFTIQFIVIDVICDILVLLPAGVVSVTLSWILTDLGCQVYGVVTIFVYLVTFSILSLRCFERVVRIRHPGLHRKLFGSHRRLAVLMMSVWFVDLLVSGIPLAGWTVISYDYYHSGCYPVLENNLYHLIVVAFLGIGLALILFIVSHVVIYNSVNSQSSQTRIEPIIIKKDDEKEESLPRTSSQNWIHDSEESDYSDSSANSESTNRHKKKKWLEINSSHNSNKHHTETDDKQQRRSPQNKPKRSGSYLRKQQEENKNGGNEKDEVREKLTKKHTLFSILYSVSTHFGICLFMIIFWMPYFIVAICRTIDTEVFRGYYSVSLCFILLTYTIRPIVHYIRLYRLIKTKRRNKVQWHREIKQEKLNSERAKVQKMNRRHKGYMSDDEGYSEESSIGFVTDSSDDQSEIHEKRHQISKRKLRGKPPSYDETLDTKNEKGERKNSVIKNTRKKPDKRNSGQRKVQKEAPIKGLPMLSKRNWYNDVDSILTDQSDSEFGEFVDETVPAAGPEAEKKQYGSTHKNKTNTKKAVEETEKRTSVEKQKGNNVKNSEQTYDSLSDESQYDANIGSVHIALKTSRSATSINDNSKFDGRETDTEQKDNINDVKNNSKHIDLKKKEYGKPSEVKYKNNAKTSTSQTDNQTLYNNEHYENLGAETKIKHLQQTKNIKNTVQADGSSNTNKESSSIKQNSTEATRRNSDQQTTSQSVVQNYSFNERRKTYGALDTEKQYIHYNSNSKEKNHNQNTRASLPDRETYLRNSASEDSAPLKVDEEDNEAKKISMVIKYDDNSSNKKVETNTNPKQSTKQLESNKIKNKSKKNEYSAELLLEKVEIKNSKTVSQIDNNHKFTNDLSATKTGNRNKKRSTDDNDKQHKNVTTDEKLSEKDFINSADIKHKETKQQTQKKSDIYKSENSLKRNSYDDKRGTYTNSELVNEQLNDQEENDDMDILVKKKYLNQSYSYNQMVDLSSSKQPYGNKAISEKDKAKTNNPSNAFFTSDNENSLVLNRDGLADTYINGYQEDTKNHQEKVESFILEEYPSVKNKIGLTTNVNSKANTNTERSRTATVDQSFSKKNYHPNYNNDINQKTQFKEERDIPSVILNKDHTTTQHYAAEMPDAQNVTDQNKYYDQANKRTNRNDSDTIGKKPSNTTLSDSIARSSNEPDEIDEVDFDKVFINRDELPSQNVSITLKDMSEPVSPVEDKGRKDNSPALQVNEKEKQELKIPEKRENITSVTQVNSTPRKTFNIYDPEEAAPISSRSLDTKPSENWYKVKSKVTSYLAISKKDKFSAIHGDDNPYDRSGGREIPISHIKDDKVWKDKLADVHLM